MNTDIVEVTEGNKLIAEFMGYKYVEENVHYENEYSSSAMDTFYSKNPIDICEFDGCKYFKELPNPDYGKENPEKWNNEIKMLGWETLNYGEFITNPEYHTSWDWLMPVVEKIESMDYAVKIFPTECNITDTNDEELIARFQIIPDDKITVVWKAVIQFIKWYNDQPKQ